MTGFALLTDTQQPTPSDPVTPPDLRERFHALMPELIASDPRAVALLADLLNPDSVVVGGQAFTCYPEGMAAMEDAFARRSTVSGGRVRATVFGDRVQEAGAGVVSLSALYADPVSATRRGRAMARWC
mgnify:CR=1 FL=1